MLVILSLFLQGGGRTYGLKSVRRSQITSPLKDTQKLEIESEKKTEADEIDIM